MSWYSSPCYLAELAQLEEKRAEDKSAPNPAGADARSAEATHQETAPQSGDEGVHALGDESCPPVKGS
jgi:hypothetical protein